MSSVQLQKIGVSSIKDATVSNNNVIAAVYTSDIEHQAELVESADGKARSLRPLNLPAYRVRKFMEQLFKYIVGGAMVLCSIGSIFGGPDLPHLWEDNPFSDGTSKVMQQLYHPSLVGFGLSFILYAHFGEWGQLRPYHRKCHRILFIAVLGLAKFFRKSIINDDPIMFSFVPVCLMTLAEFTCLFTILTAGALRCVFTIYVPWVLTKTGKAVIALAIAVGNAAMGLGMAAGEVLAAFGTA